MPVVEYARQKAADRERLLRALIVADLTTIHQKNGHRPPVRCGAVSAGCGAAAGIAYLNGGGLFRNSPHGRKRARRLFGNDMRRSQALLRRQNSRRGGGGLFGLRHEPQRQGVFDGEGIVVKGVDNTIKTSASLQARAWRRQTKKNTQSHDGEEVRALSVREAAALRRAEEFKRYYPLTDSDGSLSTSIFLAHVTHEGLDGAPEIMRRAGTFPTSNVNGAKAAQGVFRAF